MNVPRPAGSLTAQLGRTFAAIGAVVAAVFLAAVFSTALTVGVFQPELERCRQMARSERQSHAAMLDEETGLRGYLLTRDASFLEPYVRGRQELALANRELVAAGTSTPALTEATLRVRTAEDRWNERWASPAAATVRGEPGPSATEGKALFDAYRADEAAVLDAVERRIEAVSRADRATQAAAAAVELALFVVLLGVALRERRLLREATLDPIVLLLGDIARVRDGELPAAPERGGALEIRKIGEGLDAMVTALAAARATAESREGQIRAHSRRLRQILGASRDFSESLNLGHVLHAVQESTRAIADYETVTVWLMDLDGKQLAASTGAGSDAAAEGTLRVGQGLAGRAAEAARIGLEGSDGETRFHDGDPGRVRALAIPLLVGARVVGVLEARRSAAHDLTGDGMEVLEMLATHAATAIESARLYQLTEERSQRDALTRLFNRRRLEEDLVAECERSTRYGRPLAFIMLDVDHFKAFNDVHGHPQADVVLQDLARILLSEVRSTDTAYRYGGEEFCIVLRETTAVDAVTVAERLRSRIEAFGRGALSPVTASFGVAQFSAGAGARGRGFVQAADAAMYEAKRSGRNRVVRSASASSASRPHHGPSPTALGGGGAGAP